MTAPETTIPPEASLFRKIAEVMGEVGHVPKRGRNTFHNYDYVTEADLVDAISGKLAERNVAVIPSVEGIDERTYQARKGESTVTTVRMTFTFVDGDTGAMFRATWAGRGDDPADKGLYKAYTGSLKYFLMKTFLVATGDDPEADAGTDDRAGGRVATQRQQYGTQQLKPVPASDVEDPGPAAEPPATIPLWDGEATYAPDELIAAVKAKKLGAESIRTELRTATVDPRGIDFRVKGALADFLAGLDAKQRYYFGQVLGAPLKTPDAANGSTVVHVEANDIMDEMERQGGVSTDELRGILRSVDVEPPDQLAADRAGVVAFLEGLDGTKRDAILLALGRRAKVMAAT